ncbi:MAG: hypothetical protein QOH24_1188 [Verrucomicrobiota bacterium]
MGVGVVNNAERILSALDAQLDKSVELTLYGRAAFALGFSNAPKEFARSKDIDAVLWMGQADELLRRTNFWEAVDQVNRQFRDQELYVAHLFDEMQVILTPKWKQQRVRISGPWKKLKVYRLGEADLFLSKLMRNDPQDLADATFILDATGWNSDQVADIISSARVPQVAEIREQFAICAAHFLRSGNTKGRVSLGSAPIRAVTYDRKRKTLDVDFRGGGKYRYFKVPLSVYRALLKAESAGAFWNEAKEDFAYAKLD